MNTYTPNAFTKAQKQVLIIGTVVSFIIALIVSI